MKSGRADSPPFPEALCIECGLCCNGVIFADVQLQASERAAPLKALGLPVTRAHSRTLRFPQPCAALEGCRCRIYPLRPQHCREFDCLLLKRVKTLSIGVVEAGRHIRDARARAETVFRLLRELGDTDEHQPLIIRFRRTVHRLEKRALDERTAAIYAELTIAFHELTLQLSETFYRPAR